MESRLDHHAHKLLHQQLAGVRDPDLADVFAGLAGATEVLLLLDVRLAEQAALGTHVHSVAVAHVEQPFFQEPTGAVADHAVSLHLAEPQPAVPGPTFRRLSCQNLRGPSRPRVNLISDHVLQPLIVRGP